MPKHTANTHTHSPHTTHKANDEEKKIDFSCWRQSNQRRKKKKTPIFTLMVRGAGMLKKTLGQPSSPPRAQNVFLFCGPTQSHTAAAKFQFYLGNVDLPSLTPTARHCIILEFFFLAWSESGLDNVILS